MSINLSFLGRYNAGSFNDSRAEIVATDGVNINRAYVVNGAQNQIDVLNIAAPQAPTLTTSVVLTPPAGQFYSINSVAGFNGLMAAAVGVSSAAGRNPESGAVIFFTVDGAGVPTILRTVAVGAGPDMITFTNDGTKVLTANEGEPVSNTLVAAASGNPARVDTVNPEGSVSVINLGSFTQGTAAAAVLAASVTTIGFTGLTTAQINTAVGQGLKLQPATTVTVSGTVYQVAAPTVAQDIEPEYIAISADNTRAYVTLQENNGIAIIDLTNSTLLSVQGLRTINYNISPDYQLDASDQDGRNTDGTLNGSPSTLIKNQPVFGLFQPDAISSFTANGRTYLVTANEGDAREWTGAANGFAAPIVEAVRAGATSYVINPSAAQTGVQTYADVASTANLAGNLKAVGNLGRLNVSQWAGDTNPAIAGIEQITTFGTRSFTIWDTTGGTINMVWDSGKFLETFTSQFRPSLFNTNHTSNSFDTRSDDKGPEPEGIDIGVIAGVPYAFVALERFGGVAVYDLTTPSSPKFVQYINTRDFTQAPAAGQGGDLGPEGVKFISAAQSPTGKPMLAVAHEISNTTSFFNIEPPAKAAGAPAGVAYRLQLLHGSDFEAGLKSISPDGAPAGGPQTARAANFAAIVDFLEDQQVNSITLSGGDNFLPGPVYAAGGDPSLNATYNWVYNKLYNRPLDVNGNPIDINSDGLVDGYNALAAGPGRADITLLNIMGIQASALGNHDFDSGPRELSQIARQAYAGALGPAGDTWVGAQFPYLSVNLNFSTDPDTNPAWTGSTAPVREWTAFRTGPAESIAANTNNNQLKFAPSTIITENGEKIAVIGATTQLLQTISSPQAVRVVDANGNTVPSADDMIVLAAQINAETARIKLQDPSINKFVLASHLQILNNEKGLAPRLNDIDVILAAGSHTLAADPTDILRPGDVAADAYPIITTNASGKNTLIVVTANEYAYVGRLIADFDSNGDIVTANINPATSDAFSTDWAGVKRVYGINDDTALFNAAFGQGTKGYLAQAMIEGVDRATGQLGTGNVPTATLGIADVVRAKDGAIFGKSAVYLDGLRTDVRTQETNLGNLSADANLWYAKFYDNTVTVSLKNGGGIRDSIGAANSAGGSTTVTLGPTLANPSVGKNAGDISQLDIENSLRFNNALTIVSVSAQNLERLLEWGVAGSAVGVTQGRFPQLSGVEVSYDWNQTAIVFNTTTGAVTTDGARIRSLALTDQDGFVTTKLVENGVFVGDPNLPIRMVTLNFLAGSSSQPIFGGDTYPIPLYTTPGSRLDLSTQTGFPAQNVNPTGLPDAATFATQGTEQDAFAEYMRANFTATAYNKPETTRFDDIRQFNLTATADADQLSGSSLNDAINSLAGNDLIRPRGGNDTIDGGLGSDTVMYDILRGQTTVTLLQDGRIQITGGAAIGTDTLANVERVQFQNGGYLLDIAGSNAGTVYRLYQVLLDRAPDEAGFKYWVNAAGSSGSNMIGFISNIFGSDEYNEKWGTGKTNTDIVLRMYQAGLDRLPDSGGLNYWRDQLDRGSLSREQLALSFAQSSEIVNLTQQDTQPGYWVI